MVVVGLLSVVLVESGILVTGILVVDCIVKVKSNSLSNIQLKKLRSSRKAFHRVIWYSNDQKSPTLAYSGLILKPPVHFKDPNLVATYSWALTPTACPKER